MGGGLKASPPTPCRVRDRRQPGLAANQLCDLPPCPTARECMKCSDRSTWGRTARGRPAKRARGYLSPGSQLPLERKSLTSIFGSKEIIRCGFCTGDGANAFGFWGGGILGQWTVRGSKGVGFGDPVASLRILLEHYVMYINESEKRTRSESQRSALGWGAVVNQGGGGEEGGGVSWARWGEVR